MAPRLFVDARQKPKMRSRGEDFALVNRLLALSAAAQWSHARSRLPQLLRCSDAERRNDRLWPSTSVRCAAAIFPESEVDRTRRRRRENGAHDPKPTSFGI